MPITCNDLLKLKHFSSIKLLAGKKGLNRVITWPHIGQTAEISPWVHGGELLFITGIAHSKEALPALLEECIQNRLSGLVILIGDEYIETIPRELVEKAEAADFALFSMPFHLKLIDVTKEIADLIIRDTLERKEEENLLGRLLFSPDADISELLKSIFSEDMRNAFCFVCIFGLSPAKSEEHGQSERLQHHVLSLCAAKHIKISTLIQNNTVICLVFSSSGNSASAAVSYLEASHELISQLCEDNRLALSFGRVYNTCLNIRKSYSEALSALPFSGKIKDTNIIHYQNLGIYYLLMQAKSPEKIYEYYHDVLEPVLTYDTKHNANLLSTLRTYLLYNGNITKTSQKIFVHRNTLIYRLNQIQDMTGWDLEDAYTRMNLLVSILFREHLQKNA